ncbi:hypothetical protein H9L39_06063 [Fusarium oxysporum f. sp. albedinis]|nr:hypothetical protein H9L39_06063 [Fusarium oxysporum f. sp. albedinis]
MIQSFAGTATCYEAPSINDTSPAVEHYQSIEPDNAQDYAYFLVLFNLHLSIILFSYRNHLLHQDSQRPYAITRVLRAPLQLSYMNQELRHRHCQALPPDHVTFAGHSLTTPPISALI